MQIILDGCRIADASGLILLVSPREEPTLSMYENKVLNSSSVSKPELTEIYRLHNLYP